MYLQNNGGCLFEDGEKGDCFSVISVYFCPKPGGPEYFAVSETNKAYRLVLRSCMKQLKSAFFVIS